VLAAVVKVLLYRWTGQRDILVGFPIAGRDHPDLEDQIGFYVNTLPLRDRIGEGDSFLALLERVRTAATEAYEHQAYPFDLLVDELQVPRDVSRSPMLDVVVVMQNAGKPAPSIPGLKVRPFLRDYPIAKFDLGFAFEEREGELRADLSYNADLFLPVRIERMAAQLRELIASVLKDPGERVDRLPILPAAERRLIVEDWTPQPLVQPRGPTLIASRPGPRARRSASRWCSPRRARMARRARPGRAAP
jgi:non-ribosomal peptide synthetase component F